LKRDQEFPTLLDRLRASTYVADQNDAFFPQAELRKKLMEARRFVLDDKMSAMLGDLASAGFTAKTQPARHRAVEAMRMGARLPHRVTWIEYNLRQCMAATRKHTNLSYRKITDRNYQVVAGHQSDLREIPLQEGWLIEQHPQIDTAFRASLFTHHEQEHLDGFNMWQFPWTYCWVTDDSVLPWRQAESSFKFSKGGLAPLIVGLTGYESQHVGIEVSDKVLGASDELQNRMANLMIEWSGTVRRMWALLSTINSLPVEIKEVQAAKGFMARRNYHRFLDHKTVTLTIPETQYVKVARAAVAQARRRAHEVRGHWRRDWRHPISPLCEHDWLAKDGFNECSICNGRKLWIHEHQRGDASLGFVTHSYQVKTGGDYQ